MTEVVTSVTELDLPVLDRASPEWVADPVSVLEEIRQKGWLAKSALGYEVLSHAVCVEFMRDRRAVPGFADLFAGFEPPPGMHEFIAEGLLPAMSGEKHERIRRILQKAFSMTEVTGQRAMMAEVADRLIDGFIDAGRCDVIADFSHWYPIEVVCRMLGIPSEDIPRFEEWTVSMSKMGDHPLPSGFGVADVAMVQTANYLDDLIEKRRRHPEDDFVTRLIDAQEGEGLLSREELRQNLTNLLLAGHDTTRYQFAWLLYRLGRDPEAWTAVRGDRTRVRRAIDESMRVHPVVRTLIRKATEPLVYHGVEFPTGSMLICNNFAANHDPAVFPDPNRFDIDRPNANQQLTFGIGAHLCLGHALARAEMGVALERFADRLGDFTVENIEVGSLADMLGGPEHLIISFVPGPG